MMQTQEQGRRDRTGDTPPELRFSRRRRARFGNLGGVSFFDPGASVREALETAECRRVFVCGAPPAGGALLAQLDGLDGASVYLDGHYPSVTWERGRNDRVRLSWAAQWFGDGAYGADDCVAVWAALTAALQRAWRDSDVGLMMTPGTTGRDLWARTIPEGDGWPVMSPEWQSLVRGMAGQGRIETYAGPRLTAGRIHEYDARIAYMASTRNLPIGEPVEVDGRGHPHRPGKYLASWAVPAGWRHPGILPLRLGDGTRWAWPARPARDGDGRYRDWIDGAELLVAEAHGWDVRVERGFYWPTVGDPLRAWQTRILRLRDQPDGAGRRTDMWRHACRAMLLHALGGFHGAAHRVSGQGHAADVPAGASDVRPLDLERDLYAWRTEAPAAWPDMVHPEWTATIWARARARLLDAPAADRRRVGMLYLDPAALISCRTDAIYTDGPVDLGDDDGRPGAYRLKATFPQGPRPRSGADIQRMKAATDGR